MTTGWFNSRVEVIKSALGFAVGEDLESGVQGAVEGAIETKLGDKTIKAATEAAVGSVKGYSAELEAGAITNPELYRGFKVTSAGTLIGTYADDSTFDFGALQADVETIYLEQIVSFAGTAKIKMVK